MFPEYLFALLCVNSVSLSLFIYKGWKKLGEGGINPISLSHNAVAKIVAKFQKSIRSHLN